MFKKELFLIFITFFKIYFAFPCIEGKNNCLKCNPKTKLCHKCDKNILIPDEKGGCKFTKICINKVNKCIQCSENNVICKKCEKNYYPDENGGCSYSKNCEISYKGECIKCKNNYILIGENIKICKFLFSEDLKNCKKINIIDGICEECKENYFLNSGDLKCIPYENCFKSSFGICKICNLGYFLDKMDNKCKRATNESLKYCQESLDGINCEICEEDFVFDNEKKCSGTLNCIKAIIPDNKCEKCKDGFYLTENKETCTSEINCIEGIRYLGVCTKCKDGYYMDFKDGKCKSNQEYNEYQFCKFANRYNNKGCYYCIFGYTLGEDLKCVSTNNCAESDKGECILCRNNYYLGKDNRCTDVKHCKYSNFYDECIECEENYYFNRKNKSCILAEKNFVNCKYSSDGENCEICKDDFYLNKKDYSCYSNKEIGKFYKCSKSDNYGDYCVSCIDGYFLGLSRNLCTKIEGCEKFEEENENKCIECDYYHCLNLKTGKCENNNIIENEDKKYIFKCNQTNEEGNACEICSDYYNLNKNGLCVDNYHCDKKDENSNCIKCLNNEEERFCLNDIFGCIDSFDEFCLECNDILNFNKCTKCYEGYEVNRYGKCIKI